MRSNFSVLIFILKIWIVTHSIKLTESYQSQDAPIIDKLDSVTIDVNEGTTVDCKARVPITWIFESSKNLHDSIKVSYSEDDQGNYHSVLQLDSAQVYLVGFHYCVFNASLSSNVNYDYREKLKNHEASSIYVYVNDPDNKLYISDQYLIFGKQNEALVIPCKPNQPQIKVELIRDGDEEHVESEYDPKIGFTVSFMDDEESGFFECRLEEDHEVYTEFQVIINGQESTSDYVQKPWIISDSQNIAKNGASFSLSCHVEMISDAPYVIEFLLPNGNEAKNMDYLLLTETKVEAGDTRKSHRNLTVNNALETRDQGNYTCVLKDIYNNIYSTVTSITFVDKPVVQLNSSNPLVATTKGQKTAKFHFNYFVYPKPKFEWYDTQNKMISPDQDVQNDTKHSISISDDEISLTINNPGIEDFGEYTLVAYTDGERFEKKVKLVVSEKPTCKMEDAYVMHGEEIHMKCECMAYPAAEIIWSFQTCQNLRFWPHCFESDPNKPKSDQIQNETQSTQEAEYIQSSEIRFTASQPGTVKCRAKNDIGEDKIEAKVQIVDLPAPLHLSGINESHNIAIGDKVTLECGAIIYNYTDKIMWLKDEEPVEERDDLHIKDSNTRFSYRKSLTFDAIQKEDEGKYKCEVYDKNNEVHNVSILVGFHENEPPMIIANFKQQNLSEYSGNSLILTCTVSGFPIPSLIWYKNGEPFDINENDTRISLKDNDMTLTFTELKLDDNGLYECIAENSVGKEKKAIELTIKVSDFPFHLNLVIIITGAVALIMFLLCLIALCWKCLCKKKESSQ
ncbi:vascular endothelial growth factor receptor 3-like [Chironomus tepperi]|uniref:vascular endothelial growth factor receptor 3-like n=1 Tax=Chironomus tepperi TaxID=113505 RepID=UPI00391FB9B8